MAAFVDGHGLPAELLGCALPCSGVDLKSPGLSPCDILGQEGPSIPSAATTGQGFESGFLSNKSL